MKSKKITSNSIKDSSRKTIMILGQFILIT